MTNIHGVVVALTGQFEGIDRIVVLEKVQVNSPSNVVPACYKAYI